MADVYDAMDERLGRPVALKVLKPSLATDEDLKSRFAVEARSAARLSHPNVVAVFDTGEDNGVPWLVMERLPGRTLGDILKRGPVDQGRLRGWMLETLAAVGAAHQGGIVHRDLKPGNILITDDGHAKVADFGIAKSLESAPGDIDLTSTGMLLGTPAYLAPERIDGSPATPRSDLFALGVVLWEALVGHKPFDGATPLAIAAKVQHETVLPVGSLRPDADPRLANAAERAMAKDPSARPASAGEMADIITGAAPMVAVAGPATVAMAPPVGATVAMTRPVAAAAPPAAWPATTASTTRRSGLGWPVIAGIIAFLVLLVVALLIIADRNSAPLSTDTTSTTFAEVSTTVSKSSTTIAGSTTIAANAALASALRDEASRVEARGESASDGVADRLRSIADLVQSGSSKARIEATSLRNDLPKLVADGKLTAATAKSVDGVLARVPNVGPAPPPTTQKATTTTVAPTTTTAKPDGKGNSDG